jgi:hypothetical protein
MNLVPLFTQTEIEAAFCLLLPAELAASTAKSWWDQFADRIDEEGRFLYEVPQGLWDGWEEFPQIAVTAGPKMSKTEILELERKFWRSIGTKDRLEFLMRLSSFHFGLLGLVSDELHERMRVACGLTALQAEHVRAGVRRTVAAMRASASE